MKRKGGVNFLLDAVIALLCGVLLFSAFFAVSSFRDCLGLAYDTDSFYYRLTDGDFGAMVEMYYSNESTGVRADAELEQYYAIARFYEAASWYRIYAGQAESARYLAEMAAAHEDMGSLAFVADEICQTLSIPGSY